MPRYRIVLVKTVSESHMSEVELWAHDEDAAVRLAEALAGHDSTAADLSWDLQETCSETVEVDKVEGTQR